MIGENVLLADAWTVVLIFLEYLGDHLDGLFGIISFASSSGHGDT